LILAPIKKMIKVTPYLGKYALLTSQYKGNIRFDPLSLQKVTIMIFF